MAWIESHQTLKDHPKVLLFCRKLKLPRHEAIGYLHLLWWWCIDYAADGNLEKYTNEQIAAACYTEIESDTFVNTLRECGFIETIENKMRIHDWHDYCGALMERRLERLRKKSGAERPPLGAERPPTQPNPTIPNPTKPNQLHVRKKFLIPDSSEVTEYAKSIGFSLKGQMFCDYYESRGWKIGNNPMKNWQAAVRTWKTRRENENESNGGKSLPESAIEHTRRREAEEIRKREFAKGKISPRI